MVEPTTSPTIGCTVAERHNDRPSGGRVRPAKRYRGVVMLPNPRTHAESRHRWEHWQEADRTTTDGACADVGCSPRDAEPPAAEPRITSDTVVVERALFGRTDG